MAKQVIDGGKTEIHLPCRFRFEGTTIYVEDHEASKVQVVEEKIDSVIFACDIKSNLSANEREADAWLEKLLDAAYKAVLQLSFVRVLEEREEIEIVRIFEELLSKIRLRLWQRGLKVGRCLPLTLVEAAFDPHNENVPAQAALDSGLGVPKAFLWSLYLV